MKYIFLVSTLMICISSGLAQAVPATEAPFDVSEKLKELASLPEGISVSHAPDPVRYASHIPSLSGVKWQFATRVSSMAGTVTIVEFGYFVERNGKWGLPYGNEVPYTYTSSDFAEMYDCPDSEMKPGGSYSNMRNRSVIDCVPEQMVKWYFIGIDAQGDRVKGEATAKLLAELDPSEYGPQY